MFAYCYKLKSLDLSNFKGINVNSMKNIMESSSLEYLDISNFDFGRLKNKLQLVSTNAKYFNFYNSKNYDYMVEFYINRKFILNQKKIS